MRAVVGLFGKHSGRINGRKFVRGLRTFSGEPLRRFERTSATSELRGSLGGERGGAITGTESRTLGVRREGGAPSEMFIVAL